MPNPINERSEMDVIDSARTGDVDAMGELFRRHYSSCVSVARRILPAQEEYLDAVQSAYLSAFRSFGSYRGEASFRTWITRIVTNHCLMRLRHESRRGRVVSLDCAHDHGLTEVVVSNAPDPEELTQRAEFEKALDKAMARLPKLQSEIFSRCVVSGHSVRDAAEELGLTEPATKARLFRARTRMQRNLRAIWRHDGVVCMQRPAARFPAVSEPRPAAA